MNFVDGIQNGRFPFLGQADGNPCIVEYHLLFVVIFDNDTDRRIIHIKAQSEDVILFFKLVF